MASSAAGVSETKRVDGEETEDVKVSLMWILWLSFLVLMVDVSMVGARGFCCGCRGCVWGAGFEEELKS